VPWKRISTIGTIALLCFGALLALDRFAPVTYLRARNLLRDAITRAGRTTPANPDLVFLAIDRESVSLEEGEDIEQLYGLRDADSMEARGLRLMSKVWPWPREVYALILERLVNAGAKVVLFDLLFPTHTDGDEPFRLALDRFAKKTLIGSNFVSSSGENFAQNRTSHTRPVDSLIPATVPMDDRIAYVNLWPDDDGVVRSARFQITFGQISGEPPTAQSERFLSLAARGLQKAGFADRIPEGPAPSLIRFTGPAREGFRPHSIFEIFVPEYWRRNYQSGEFFRDKIVVVGAEGNWQHDELATPFGSMPGPELHLNAINAALHGEFIDEFSPRGVAIFALLAGAVAIGLTFAIGAPWLRLVALAAADVLCLGLALEAYNRLNLHLPTFAGLTELNVTVLFGLIWDFTLERVEKTRVRRMLEKYVSSNVVRELLDQPKTFQQSLGGTLKPATILFSDLRGYTIIGARSDPHALVAQLNEYLTAMVEWVFRYDGTLDKFIGDALMAVWGNVRSDGVREDTANAVRAALAMREELARLNESWRERGWPELRAGIAVHQGDVVAGNIGSARRMEFTVIGDVVNVTWKMQELTKQLHSPVLVSRAVSVLLIEDFELCSLGRRPIPGHAEPMEIFSVLGPIQVEESSSASGSVRSRPSPPERQ
jgi:adenylate cyclase